MPLYNLIEYSENYKKKKQEVCGIIIEMNQVILSLLILNILNIRKALQEVLTTLMMVKLVMMKINETKLVIPLKHLSNF